MDDDESVGYGKPPRQHRFKPGNQAAAKGNRRRKKRANALALPEILDRALRSKRKIKRGGQVYTVPVAEIMVERLVQMLTTGSTRDVALVMQLTERYLPDALTRTQEVLEIVHTRAAGSNIELPPEDLWEVTKP